MRILVWSFTLLLDKMFSKWPANNCRNHKLYRIILSNYTYYTCQSHTREGMRDKAHHFRTPFSPCISPHLDLTKVAKEENEGGKEEKEPKRRKKKNTSYQTLMLSHATCWTCVYTRLCIPPLFTDEEAATWWKVMPKMTHVSAHVSHSDPPRQGSLSPSYSWGNWGSERPSSFLACSAEKQVKTRTAFCSVPTVPHLSPRGSQVAPRSAGSFATVVAIVTTAEYFSGDNPLMKLSPPIWMGPVFFASDFHLPNLWAPGTSLCDLHVKVPSLVNACLSPS